MSAMVSSQIAREKAGIFTAKREGALTHTALLSLPLSALPRALERVL